MYVRIYLKRDDGYGKPAVVYNGVQGVLPSCGGRGGGCVCDVEEGVSRTAAGRWGGGSAAL